MRTTFLLPVLAAAWLAAPVTVHAQHFAGTVRYRTMSIQRDALEERGFDVSEAIFDVPIGRFLELRDELEADGSVELSEMTILMKGSRLRVDEPSEEGPAYALLDLETGVMQLVRPGERLYMEMTPEDRDRMLAMGGAANGGAATPEAVATGERRSVNGLGCTVYRIATEARSARVCVSTENAGLTASFRAFAEWSVTMETEDGPEPVYVAARHGFPVLEQSLDDETYRIGEVIAIEPGQPSDDQLEPPPGFRKVTMAEMMGQGRGR